MDQTKRGARARVTGVKPTTMPIVARGRGSTRVLDGTPTSVCLYHLWNSNGYNRLNAHCKKESADIYHPANRQGTGVLHAEKAKWQPCSFKACDFDHHTQIAREGADAYCIQARDWRRPDRQPCQGQRKDGALEPPGSGKPAFGDRIRCRGAITAQQAPGGQAGGEAVASPAIGVIYYNSSCL
jgi:hypothetical protein